MLKVIQTMFGCLSNVLNSSLEVKFLSELCLTIKSQNYRKYNTYRVLFRERAS